MKINQADIDKQRELELNAHLAEYAKVSDELIQRIGSLNQSVVYVLGSASIFIPYLISQTNRLPSEILVAGLYILAIVYAILGLDYAGTLYYINAAQAYIYQQLGPRINETLKTTSVNAVFQGEIYSRKLRRGIVALYLSTIGPAAITTLILLPSIIALLATQYISLKTGPETNQILTSFLKPLSIIAWTIFGISALGQLFQMVFALTNGFIETAKPERNK